MRPWGGGSITSELFAVVGSTVPNYSGMFLRGRGGNAGALGQTQIDTIRPITGAAGQIVLVGMTIGEGAFTTSPMPWSNVVYGGQSSTARFSFDSSRLGVHYSGTETRPVNMAVRYLIRARP
jgi:hypothetical protein